MQQKAIKSLKLTSINIIIFLSLLIFVESFSVSLRFLLKKSYKGFLYKSPDSITTEELADHCRRMRTHPILSHVHDHRNKCKIKGGKVDGQWSIYNDINNQTNYILTLGGSTTDGLFGHLNNGYTWPLELSRLVKNNKLDYQVWNGGV